MGLSMIIHGILHVFINSGTEATSLYQFYLGVSFVWFYVPTNMHKTVVAIF